MFFLLKLIQHAHTYRHVPHVHFCTVKTMPNNVPVGHNHLLQMWTKAGMGTEALQPTSRPRVMMAAMHMDERGADVGDWQER